MYWSTATTYVAMQIKYDTHHTYTPQAHAGEKALEKRTSAATSLFTVHLST